MSAQGGALPVLVSAENRSRNAQAQANLRARRKSHIAMLEADNANLHRENDALRAANCRLKADVEHFYNLHRPIPASSARQIESLRARFEQEKWNCRKLRAVCRNLASLLSSTDDLRQEDASFERICTSKIDIDPSTSASIRKRSCINPQEEERDEDENVLPSFQSFSRSKSSTSDCVPALSSRSASSTSSSFASSSPNFEETQTQLLGDSVPKSKSIVGDAGWLDNYLSLQKLDKAKPGKASQSASADSTSISSAYGTRQGSELYDSLIHLLEGTEDFQVDVLNPGAQQSEYATVTQHKLRGFDCFEHSMGKYSSRILANSSGLVPNYKGGLPVSVVFICHIESPHRTLWS